MFALVVLAAAAALVGALGTLLAALFGAGRRDSSHDSRHGSGRHGSRSSRHRGGAAALPRAAAATVSLLVAAVPLLFVVEPNRLGLAAVALWWLSLPWLAVTSRLGAWAHAAWTHAVSGAALGLVDLAWQATTQQRPLLPAVGVWALWLVVAATAIAVLAYLRDIASSNEGPGLVRLRPAVVTAMAVCGVGAAAASLAVQDQSAPASVEASARMAQGSTPGATPAAPSTAAPAPTTTAPTRESESTAAARSQRRTATPTSSTRTSTVSSTTAPRRSTASPTGTPTGTQSSTSTTTSPTTTTTAPLDLKIWPSNNPHTTPPGHR